MYIDRDRLVAGAQFTLEGVMHLTQYGELVHCNCDMSVHGYTPLVKVSVPFTLPADFNLTAAKVAAVDKEIEAAVQKVAEAREKKAQLLQLTMTDGTTVLGAVDYSKPDDGVHF